ncbi:hypothetical protein [Pseudidiomarina donghaiensis]|uniref:Uncharacterized protein n=1 Tax=Pseudidiomarina donghaiensis TaxID=519452 RepID=A0A432XJJ6_9GAMM|nr:hypothetical protein [Pseudidiomarina donghaiensis]RUO48944.1 hypothetical protein CWE24_00030 [Pseudidiomarina donghaiensis]SFV20262.1 hypothetical protein SAMN04488139_0132 [Pseudidiomarina donghaiensis]
MWDDTNTAEEHEEMAGVRQEFFALYNKRQARIRIKFIDTAPSMLRSFYVVSFLDRRTKSSYRGQFSDIYWPSIFNDFASLQAHISSFLKQYAIPTAFLEQLTWDDPEVAFELDLDGSCPRK